LSVSDFEPEVEVKTITNFESAEDGLQSTHSALQCAKCFDLSTICIAEK